MHEPSGLDAPVFMTSASGIASQRGASLGFVLLIDRERRCLMRGAAILAGLVVALAGCGGGEPAASEGSPQSPSASLAASLEPTSTQVPSSAASSMPITVTRDLTYLDEDGAQFHLDVYAPETRGSWPVAVAFHGAAAGLKSDSYVTVVAKAAAKAGMVVLVPSWVPGFPGSVHADDLTGGFARSSCALAYAQQEAAAYGGDPTRIVTYGFSAGSPEAAWLALGHATTIPSGCHASVAADPPVGAVLGDSEYFLHSGLFQEGFDTDPEGMLVHVRALVDPASWPADLSATFRLWSAADGTQARAFDDPWAADGWLAQRDPDGSIRQDLQALGQLDDGVISFIDEGELLAARLQSAGLDATVELYPGGHTISGKLPQLVAYLLEVAG
jgi:acetyl esterase/lipase